MGRLTTRRQAMRLGLALLAALLLNGCLLRSGELTSTDAQPGAGNISTSFVSAEGQNEQVLATGQPGMLNVIAIVSVQQGELTVDVLDPNGSVMLSVQSRPNESVTKSGNVPTDSEGQLHYRISARGARAGSYQILYQRQDQ